MLNLCPNTCFHIFIMQRLLIQPGMLSELFYGMRTFGNKPLFNPMCQRVPFFCPAISGIGEDNCYRLRNQAIRRIQVMHICRRGHYFFRQACGRINSNMSFSYQSTTDFPCGSDAFQDPVDRLYFLRNRERK